MNDFLEFFQKPEVLTTLGFILAILGTIIKLFGSRLRNYINGKIIEPLTKLIKKLSPTVIGAVNQELVDELRKKGEWAENKCHEAMELSYTKMQSLLTKGQWSILEKYIGKDEVREFIKTIINDTIRELKTTNSYANSKINKEILQQ